MEAVETVLGLRGVRAQIVSRALAGLQEVANARLARLFEADVRLSLSPTTERASGQVVDAIALGVFGIGGNLGYKAVSSGQRRRVDVALVLALADVSDAALGRKPGTVWFDEVFDTLDAQGVSSTSEILLEMSRTRPVVVISHNPDLVAALGRQADVRVQVENHQVRMRYR